jgi:cobalt-zinc-cadmium efflux system protein
VIVEAGAGIFANSLALLTDAAHNLTDVIALGLTWFAVHITAQPANAQRTYGYHRAGILVALLNSTTLVLISLGIFYEAYRRFLSPPEVQSNILIGVGLIAVVINLVTALLVHRGSDKDLSLRSAFVHLMGDVLSTVGAFDFGGSLASTFTAHPKVHPITGKVYVNPQETPFAPIQDTDAFIAGTKSYATQTEAKR